MEEDTEKPKNSAPNPMEEQVAELLKKQREEAEKKQAEKKAKEAAKKLLARTLRFYNPLAPTKWAAEATFRAISNEHFKKAIASMPKEEAKYRMKEKAPVYVTEGNYIKIVMSETTIIECFIHKFLDYIPEDAEGNMTLIPDDEAREH